jgi:hypothetical protein
MLPLTWRRGLLILGVLAVWFLVVVPRIIGAPPDYPAEPPVSEWSTPGPVESWEVVELRAENKRLTRQVAGARRYIRGLRRAMLRRHDVREALNLSCTVYGNCATLWRRARCESANFTDFYNDRSGATGVLQFLPSTWRTTPFARFSIASFYANALAGGWMHAHGRGGEWSCR